MAAAGRLRQVVLNLLGNAVKFTRRGQVMVRVSRERSEGDRVVLRVVIADTGVGIPLEVQERLFEPFHQGDGSTTRQFGGTGLGLAISRRLVSAMGGEIGLESAPDQGSTFWFTVTFGQAQRERANLPERRLPRDLRILIADDSALAQETLRHYLSAWGISPVCAADHTEALRLLCEGAQRGEPFDIALIGASWQAPGGIRLARAISDDETLGQVRMIALTSLAGVPPVSETALREELGDQRRPLRILVAEDNAVNQKVALALLMKLGYSADVVANGLEALQALSRIPYDIVLMDVHMPEMDGYEATRRIRRGEGRGRRTVVIAMTANAMSGEREGCLAAGMDDYLAKPVKPETLRELLEEWSNTIQSHSLSSA